MRGAPRNLSSQQIKQGYSLLQLMESLDREMDLLNQRRINLGLRSEEGRRLTQVRQSHLRKIQDCVSELETIGFNDWLLQQSLA